VFKWDEAWYEGRGPVKAKGDWKDTLKRYPLETGSVFLLAVLLLVWWGVS
jgi:hypothetical protein